MRRSGAGKKEQADIDGLNRRSKKVKKQSSSSYNREKKEDLVPLKPLVQEEEGRREEALIAKVQQCKRVFDFSDATVDVRNKEIKRSALYDIVDYLVTQKTRVVTERVIKEIVECSKVNIFRDMNPGQDSELDFMDEDEPILEESWPHLSLVYDMLLKLIEHPEFEPKLAKRYIDQSVIQELLRVLNSTDAREREIIKTILHRIYGRFLGHRAFIRKAIAHTFLAFTFESLVYRGISELLEILSSIINGFALPLKQEHVDFLKRVLIPLHRSYYLHLYLENLTTCIEQYIEKDPELTPDIVNGLLHIWPKINSQKEVSMLSEMEELIEKLGLRDFENEQQRQEIFKKVMKPLFKQMAKCCCSTNFQVAEKALVLWNNEVFIHFFEQNNAELMAIVAVPLHYASKNHWNPQIAKLIQQVMKALMDINPAKYEEVIEQAKESEKQHQKATKGASTGHHHERGGHKGGEHKRGSGGGGGQGSQAQKQSGTGHHSNAQGSAPGQSNVESRRSGNREQRDRNASSSGQRASRSTSHSKKSGS
ncbi:serine/threonine-protein phosphatase 2A 56 kDa regulatory subunit epsilon isoform-like [Convolutriloba macropyga]|uniref:serine/threonine-protein phosphatase 2A 56 kDa regulatory subunit epsilon isoform-like n=1 Tax=Convolutriloba macropyga TaxID=536237 RepID=UPI003F5249BB